MITFARVEDNQVRAPGPDDLLDVAEGVFEAVRALVVDGGEVDAEAPSRFRAGGVVGIHERGPAAVTQYPGDGLQRERGLAGSLGAEQFRDPPPRPAPHPEREIEAERAGGHGPVLDVVGFDGGA